MEDKIKLALVTGAAGALGLATSRTLIVDGYRVILVDLDQNKLDKLASELGHLAIPVALDRDIQTRKRAHRNGLEQQQLP